MIKAIAHSNQRCLPDCLPFSYANGPPLSTAQNSSTIMAKLYPLYPAVLGQVGGEGSEGGGREVEEERK